MDAQKLKAYERLKELLREAEGATYQWEDDGRFDHWVQSAKNSLVRLFGKESDHVQNFENLFLRRYARLGGRSPSFYEEHFRARFGTILAIVRSAVEDFEAYELNESVERQPSTQTSVNSPSNPFASTGAKSMREIFISHSSLDKDIVDELVNILEAMKIPHDRIYCSSKPGYGTPFGKDFLKYIPEKLRSGALVLFVLSDNFYKSPICMCEMGAAWALSSELFPILVPPFDFEQVRGVFPTAAGLKVNDCSELNALKEQLKPSFDIMNDHPDWEGKRNAAVSKINEKLMDRDKSTKPRATQSPSAESSRPLSSSALAVLRCFAKRDTDELARSDIMTVTGLSFIDVKLALAELEQKRIADVFDDHGYTTVTITDDVGLRAVKDATSPSGIIQ